VKISHERGGNAALVKQFYPGAGPPHGTMRAP
jgi:hypothetical protein